MNEQQYKLPAMIDNLRLRGHFFTAAFLVLSALTAGTYIYNLTLPILISLVFQSIAAFYIIVFFDIMHLQPNYICLVFGNAKGLAFSDLNNNNRTNNSATEWVIGSWLYAGFASMSTLAGEVTNPQVVS